MLYQNISIISLGRPTLVCSVNGVATAPSLYGKASLLADYTLMNGWGVFTFAAHQKCLLITGLVSDSCFELAVGEVLQ